jgi:hypothetical protein
MPLPLQTPIRTHLHPALVVLARSRPGPEPSRMGVTERSADAELVVDRPRGGTDPGGPGCDPPLNVRRLRSDLEPHLRAVVVSFHAPI